MRASEIVSYLRIAALAAVLATLVRTMVFETYYVPSESMLPTLLVGDHMLVNKLSFGPRIPFTDVRLAGRREPARGDVVIFDLGRRSPKAIFPLDRCLDCPSEGFVKRIVGLPGDIIEVRSGRVLVNGEAVPFETEHEPFTNAAGVALTVRRELMKETSHRVLDDPKKAGRDQVRIRVPDDRYFMLGDNRDNSSDSRSWGTVHRKHIVGPVIRIYWSWNNSEPLMAMWNPLVWWRLLTTETRWDRAGIRVE
jgi:signal peptidase I